MAVTVAPLATQGTYVKVFTVIATADADTTATIPHTLTGTPLDISFMPMTAAGVLSAWTFTSADATNVVLTKATAVGSGAAPIQLRVTIALPHSIAA